jgi:hypothetical protein
VTISFSNNILHHGVVVILVDKIGRIINSENCNMQSKTLINKALKIEIWPCKTILLTVKMFPYSEGRT